MGDMQERNQFIIREFQVRLEELAMDRWSVR